MKPLLFIDTETTGLTPQDRLCQIAYRSTEEDEIVSGYFLPPIPVSLDAMSMNHITNKFLENKKPFTHSMMFAKLTSLLKTHIVVAHNAPFDIGMFEREGLKVGEYICTKKVAKHFNLADKNNLQYLRYALDLDVPEAVAHTADGDLKVLIALFQKLQEYTAVQEMVIISYGNSMS